MQVIFVKQIVGWDDLYNGRELEEDLAGNHLIESKPSPVLWKFLDNRQVSGYHAWANLVDI